jgi:glycine cleavage system H protein
MRIVRDAKVRKKDESSKMTSDVVRYTESHEWVRRDGDLATVGITPFAVEQLGDIVYIELPQIGKQIEQGATFGDVESVKAVSDLYAPVGGEVAEVNEALQERPELINEDPQGMGWLLKLRESDRSQFDALMTADQYQQHVAEQG